MKPIDARIKDGKFEFSLAAVLDHPEGTTFKIVPADTRSTTKLRRYLVVCCKYVFYQHPHANWETWKDAWAALKMEFFFDMVWGLDGTRQKVARSSMRLHSPGRARYRQILSSRSCGTRRGRPSCPFFE